MQCKKGCSRCCYVDLSVFSIEADFIRDWFNRLSGTHQNELKHLWEIPGKEALNFNGETVESCPFLVNETCSIYEARPIICRTQGLALLFELNGEEATDACPLNFNNSELEVGDLLDLDRLNYILSTLQVQQGGEERVKLEDLKKELKG